MEKSPETELAGMVTVTAVSCPASNVLGWKSATRQLHDERTRSRFTADSSVFLTVNVRACAFQAGNRPRSKKAGDTDSPCAKIAIVIRYANTPIVRKQSFRFCIVLCTRHGLCLHFVFLRDTRVKTFPVTSKILPWGIFSQYFFCSLM